MSILLLSLGLFVIGLIEYAIDQYQKLLLSRLKLKATVVFQLINKVFEAAINLYVFGTIIIFWQKFQLGDHNFLLLLPYLLYTLGTVAGTGLALWHYRKKKRQTSRERNKQFLKKANEAKKFLRDMKDELIAEVETELELDESEIVVETENIDADKTVHDQDKSERETPQKEGDNQTPSQPA